MDLLACLVVEGVAMLRRSHPFSRLALTSGLAAIVALLVLSGTAPAHAAIADTSPSTCAQWNISGTWHAQQANNANPTFNFQQNGTSLSGTASTTVTGTLTGTVVGNHLDFVVTWSSTSAGHYTATVTQGGIVNGQSNDQFRPGSNTSWTASGPTQCVGGSSTGAAGPTGGATAGTTPGFIPGITTGSSGGTAVSGGAGTSGNAPQFNHTCPDGSSIPISQTCPTPASSPGATSASSGSSTGSPSSGTASSTNTSGNVPASFAPLWTETEFGGGCTGTWTQQSGTTYTMSQTCPNGAMNTATMTITVNGSQVTIARTNSSDGNNCTYQGTLSTDGNSMSGTYSCTLVQPPSPGSWSATAGTAAPSTGTSASGGGGGCNWGGTWDTHGANGIITLTQNGSQVTGGDGGAFGLNGTVSGADLTGTWSYGSDHGAIMLTMDSSCNSFSGFEGLNGSTSVTAQTGNSYTGTRLSGSPTLPASGGGSSGTTSGNSNAANGPAPTGGQKLGSIDFDGYCKSQGYAGAGLGDVNINGWYCASASNRVGIDPAAACQWQYQQPTAVARWDNFNDPRSWACFAAGSSPPSTGGGAGTPSGGSAGSTSLSSSGSAGGTSGGAAASAQGQDEAGVNLPPIGTL
jgi:hypothetical protein